MTATTELSSPNGAGPNGANPGAAGPLDQPRVTTGRDLSTTPETPANGPVDRLDAIWKGKRWILLAALVAAALTLLTTALIPKTFSSSIQVGLNASPVTGSSVSDLATASNSLAAQYAQLVTSEAVLRPAAEATGTTSGQLSTQTSASTLAAQNIVQITVQASDPAQAQARADALGSSLVDYITTQGAAASAQYSDTVVAQLKPLDDQILTVRKRVDAITSTLSKTDEDTAPQSVSASAARLSSAQSLLTSLTDRRSNLVSQATLQSISLAPRAQILGGAAAGIQVEPRPALYTLVAAVLGLVIGTQVVLTAADRRQRRHARAQA